MSISNNTNEPLQSRYFPVCFLTVSSGMIHTTECNLCFPQIKTYIEENKPETNGSLQASLNSRFHRSTGIAYAFLVEAIIRAYLTKNHFPRIFYSRAFQRVEDIKQEVKIGKTPSVHSNNHLEIGIPRGAARVWHSCLISRISASS